MSIEHESLPSSSDGPLPRRALVIAALMTALIVAFFVLREHGGHVAGYWPYLVVAGVSRDASVPWTWRAWSPRRAPHRRRSAG